MHEVTEDGAYRLLTMSPEDSAVWIQNSPNNIDHTITVNGQYLGEATGPSLALSYSEVDPEFVVNAYNTAMNCGRVAGKFTTDTIQSEQDAGTSLSNQRDTWLCQAVVAAEADFESVYTAGLNEYLAMGGQDIIDERAEKLAATYGVTIETDLLTK